jgi:chromosome partitioning protein
MKILCIANQKGGVGKSTLTVHLAYAALEAGKRVLLVDMDKQGSLSLSFPNPNNRVDTKIALEASHLYGGLDYTEGRQPIRLSEKLSIVRSDMGLLKVDKAENEVISRPGVALRQFSSDFDICLIDTPPLLGIRLMASLAASDFVLTPVNIGLYELAGLADLLSTIHVIRTQGFNPRLLHLGILLMKTNTRSGEQKEALVTLRERYGDSILPDDLPERAAVRKAVSSRVPVWSSPSGSGHVTAAKEWKKVSSAILKKVLP